MACSASSTYADPITVTLDFTTLTESNFPDYETRALWKESPGGYLFELDGFRFYAIERELDISGELLYDDSDPPMPLLDPDTGRELTYIGLFRPWTAKSNGLELDEETRYGICITRPDGRPFTIHSPYYCSRDDAYNFDFSYGIGADGHGRVGPAIIPEGVREYEEPLGWRYETTDGTPVADNVTSACFAFWGDDGNDLRYMTVSYDPTAPPAELPRRNRTIDFHEWSDINIQNIDPEARQLLGHPDGEPFPGASLIHFSRQYALSGGLYLTTQNETTPSGGFIEVWKNSAPSGTKATPPYIRVPLWGTYQGRNPLHITRENAMPFDLKSMHFSQTSPIFPNPWSVSGVAAGSTIDVEALTPDRPQQVIRASFPIDTATNTVDFGTALENVTVVRLDWGLGWTVADFDDIQVRYPELCEFDADRSDDIDMVDVITMLQLAQAANADLDNDDDTDADDIADFMDGIASGGCEE